MMKRTIIKELVWLLGCLIAAFLLFWFVADSRALDINMYDTYMPGSEFGRPLATQVSVPSYFILLGFFVYLIRAVYFNFSFVLTNFILLILAGVALYYLNDIMFYVFPPIIDKVPPLSTPVKGLFYGSFYSTSHIWCTHIMKILLMLTLIFTGFMIGRKWPKGIVS